MKTRYIFIITSLIALLILSVVGCQKDNEDEQDDIVQAKHDNSVCKYENSNYMGHIWQFDNRPMDIACTADGKKIWVVTQYPSFKSSGGELKQGDENGNFTTIDTFEDTPISVALSDDGSLGYVLTMAHNLCKYVNGEFVGHIHHFEDYPNGVACDADGTKVWVVTKGKELKEGDENGNFFTLDTFADYSGVSAALSEDGSLGLVLRDGTKVCKYVSDVFVGHIWEYNMQTYDIACDAFGDKVWIIDGEYLFEGDEHGNFSQIDSFGNVTHGAALSADGYYGYVVTAEGLSD